MFNFKFLRRSKYSVNDKVITDDGFSGVIEAVRRHKVGYESYEFQSLVQGTNFCKDYGKRRWVSDRDIAFKLSAAQVALIQRMQNNIKFLKEDNVKLNRELEILKTKEESNV